MKMNNSSLLFVITLVVGSLLAISSSTWIGTWMGLEINLLSFIPLMAQSNKFSAEAALKYFLTQAFASAILLIGVIGSSMGDLLTGTPELLKTQILIFALLVKMGAAPTHFWFPEVANGLDWGPNMILMTWQKIAPFVILMYLSLPGLVTTTVVSLSAMVGAFGGFNQLSLRKILAYSSINHMAWMLISISASQSLWAIYFSTYSVMTLVMMTFFNINKMNTLSQMINTTNVTFMEQFSLSFNMLSMGGLPPFLGFFPKWMVMEHLILQNMFVLALVMISMTLIVLYFYLRLTYASFMFYHSSLKPSLTLSKPSSHLLLWFSILGLLSGPLLVMI